MTAAVVAVLRVAVPLFAVFAVALTVAPAFFG